VIEKLFIMAGSALLGLLVLYPLYTLLRRGFIHSFREWGPRHHLQKEAVPTAGGLLFIIMLAIGIVIGIYVMPDLSDLSISSLYEALVIFCATAAFGLLGFIDDYMKVVRKSSLGFPARHKFVLQILFALAALHFTYKIQPEAFIFTSPTPVVIPAWIYFPLGTILLVGLVNAFNFTDGLDGLAAGTAFFSLAGYSVLFIAISHNVESSFDRMLAFISLVVAGAVLAFLIPNFKPAHIYMGDTGSYFLGAFLGITAIAGGFIYYLIPLSIVYGAELISVVLQVSYFRLTKGKRLFKMSPLHHHLELSGMSEVGIVFVFWAMQLVVSTGCAVVFILNQR
jgi:phospho-N-acetylmuramoyl-pentapeptide-transferase